MKYLHRNIWNVCQIFGQLFCDRSSYIHFLLDSCGGVCSTCLMWETATLQGLQNYSRVHTQCRGHCTRSAQAQLTLVWDLRLLTELGIMPKGQLCITTPSLHGNTPLYCTSSGYSLLPLMYICTYPPHYTCYVHFVAEKTATFPCMSLWLLSGAGWFVLLLLHCHPLSFVGA